jgi:hypothetical protein
MVKKQMETITNRFGEKQTSWTSHKHPNNPNFMQVVRFMHIQKPDGKNTLYWSLANASANDKHFIADMTLEKAKELFVDAEIKELTDVDLEKWLKQKQV